MQNLPPEIDLIGPTLYPAIVIAPHGCWLQCGACGCSKEVEFYFMVDDQYEPFQPVCDCPIPAILLA